MSRATVWASFAPGQSGRNSWTQVAATSLAAIGVAAMVLSRVEPANGNQASPLGQLWWVSAYAMVALPLYLVISKLVGGGWRAVVLFGITAGVLATAELVWYALAMAGSW